MIADTAKIGNKMCNFHLQYVPAGTPFRCLWNDLPIRQTENCTFARLKLNAIARLMHQAVVCAAQQDQVIHGCLTTIGPVLNMVRIDEPAT